MFKMKTPVHHIIVRAAQDEFRAMVFRGSSYEFYRGITNSSFDRLGQLGKNSEYTSRFRRSADDIVFDIFNRKAL